MITLSPPKGKAPFKRIKLHSGLTVHPDFENGGRVNVADQADADELIAEGWRMDDESAKAARFNTDLLRKGLFAQMWRAPGIGDLETTVRHNTMTMAEFNVDIGGEKVRVKRGDRVIVVAGVELPVDELPVEVRRDLNTALARLDGASFYVDSNLMGVQEARRLIEVAIMAVMASTPFRDRLITHSTRRALEKRKRKQCRYHLSPCNHRPGLPKVSRTQADR